MAELHIEPWLGTGAGRLLIVDSDADAARMVEVRMLREGYEVRVAHSSEDAERVVAELGFEVAIVDGAERGIAQSLLDVPEATEVLIVAEDATLEMELEAYELGAFDVVSKPYANLTVLTHKVSKAVAKVQAERSLHAGRGGSVVEPAGHFGIDLDRMSGVDPLTGLPNRRAAEDRFRTETSRALRYDRPLCIAKCSVDDLDLVVGRFGRDVADGVLRGIVQVFQAMVRDVDFIARFDGGEFFLLFPETAKDSGFVVVDRIRQKLLSTAFTDEVGPEGQFRLTASFGVAGLPTDTMNAEILREAADAALHRARATGGDQVVLYDAGMSRRS